MTAIEELGDFVAMMRFRDLPEVVIAKAERHCLDTLGAGIAGATSEEARRAFAALTAAGEGGESIVLGCSGRATPRAAAYLNGIATHAFEVDDTGGCAHSGAVVLPAVLACLAIRRGPVDGGSFIVAVVVGYDVGRRILDGFGGYRPHNEAGWHSTGTCGTFAAAAAASSVLELDAGQSRAALGIAASFAAGLWGFIHDGAMTKRLHAGRAAEGGLLAALMAKEGITGPQAIFDDVWGGFFRTYAHGPTDIDAVTRGLGEEFSILRCAVKPYAACRDTHAAVDAIDRLLVRHGLAADDVASINARLDSYLEGKLGGHDVSTLPAAQMSLPYAVAARIAFGEAGLAAYTPERRADPSLIDLVQRVTIERDETVRETDASDVTLVTRDGRRFREPTRAALGDPANPLTDEQLLAKFRGLARLALPKDRVDALVCTVLQLRSQEDVRPLAALTVPG